MKYTLIVFTENKPGVLYRIADIFLRRKINIESLTVSEIPGQNRSRFTIVLVTDEKEIQKISLQLDRIIEVLEVYFRTDDEIIYHEIALVKIALLSPNDSENIENYIKQFSARVFKADNKYMVIEITGTEKEIVDAIKKLSDFPIKDIAVSGRTAVFNG